MAESDSLKRNSDVSWRTIEGQSVLVFNREGEVRVLNDVGTYVWEHVEETPAAMAAEIAKQYDVSEEEALKDVFSFIEEMKGIGALI